MKAPSPLLGFNNNVKHKGRVFHIQTEDSGIKHPHVITHLFVDGGRILKSTKTSYAEFLEDEQMATKVRQLMQEQHKAMFIALRAGKFDHLMEGDGAAPSSDAKAPAPPPSQAGAAEKPEASADGPPKSDAKAESPAEAAAKEAAKDAAAAKDGSKDAAKDGSKDAAKDGSKDAAKDGSKDAAKDDAQPISAQPASLRGASQASMARVRPPTAPPSRDGRGSAPPNPVALRPPSLIPPPPRAPSPSMQSIQAFTHGDRKTDPRAETEAAMPAADPRPRVNSPLELNLEALERSAQERAANPVAGSDLRDLPPPPAAVLGKKPASIDTSYRSIAPPRADTAISGPPPQRPSEPSGARTPPPPASSPSASAFSSGPPMRPRTAPYAGGIARPPTSERRSVTPQGARYAPSRPASIFGSARPQEGSSIFGEDLISEKSLDEVILSYLAEDLEGSKKG